MTIALLNAGSPPADDRAELKPEYFDCELIVTPEDNPAYSPESLSDLLESMRFYKQLVPGFVCPSPELPPGKLLCVEGNRRLKVCRMLGLHFWAFKLDGDMKEAERIRLKFHHHASRRRMSREEMAREAARYIELTNCTQGQAAKLLNVSDATLSRAFRDKRILPHLKERADLLVPSIRTLVASAPEELMEQVLDYAETPSSNGRLPIRDHVALFIRQEKKKANGPGKGRKPARPKTITLKMNGRAVTFSVGDKDTAFSVTEDLKAIVAKLGRKDIAETVPDGWPFHFEQ